MSAQPSDGDQSIADKANSAFLLVTQDIIERAKRFRTKIAVWRDGQVVTLTPEEVEAELDAQKSAGQGAGIGQVQ
jgi:hypothetical protein